MTGGWREAGVRRWWETLLIKRNEIVAWLRRRLRDASGRRVYSWQVEGPFDSSYSLAIENREIALALSGRGELVALTSRDGPGPFAPDALFLQQNPSVAAMWRRGCSNAAAEITVRNTYPPFVADMQGKWRGLVCFAWEESGFPPEYVASFNAHLHFITVISGFVAKVLRDNGVRIPIYVIGCGIDQITRLEQDVRTTGSSQRFWIGDALCFLHVSTCLPRKGLDVLLAAWVRAFDPDDNVILVIKATANQHHRIEDDVAALANDHPHHARILVINQHLPSEDIYALFRRADVVVCPSRGEGFALPLAEALALGKPVVATGHGGQMEFCRAENAWLCDYDFAYSRSHVRTSDSVWAEPRLDSLIDCLRQARAASPAERECRGAHGQAIVRANFNWNRVAERLYQAVTESKRRTAATTRPPKVGLVSTWNSACAIAEYARSLTSGFTKERLVIFANLKVPAAAAGESSPCRCWNSGGADSLADLYSRILSHGINALVIQFTFGLYDADALASLILRLEKDGVTVYLFLHETMTHTGAPTDRLPELSALQSARRLFVHSVHDLNRLKRLGLVDNVTLFPFGVPAAHVRAEYRAPARIGYALDGDIEIGEETSTRMVSGPLIASCGFLLPGKGFGELIEAFALLLREFPRAKLLLLTPVLPGHEREHDAYESAIRKLGLADCVTMRTDFLVEENVVSQLASADIVVYPYQHDRRSASAAVRLGLASLRPVATTSMPMFDDVASVSHRLAGNTPNYIAAGLAQLLRNPEQLERHASAQKIWVDAHSWQSVAQRLDGLVSGEASEDVARSLRLTKTLGQGLRCS